MTAVAVTAYVPIPEHPRSEQEYDRLAEPLFMAAAQGRLPLLMYEGELEQCWLYRYVHSQPKGFTWSQGDNPKKNSLGYMCVQAQKSEWLLEAAISDTESDIFVWIDYGILHVPGVTVDIICDFLRRAENERAIAIPGCWDEDYIYDDNYPCWRWAGGCIVVPRRYVQQFDDAVKREYIRWLDFTGNISWEVNCWARLEKLDKTLPLWHYKADHDSSMFLNYRATESADAQKIALN